MLPEVTLPRELIAKGERIGAKRQEQAKDWPSNVYRDNPAEGLRRNILACHTELAVQAWLDNAVRWIGFSSRPHGQPDLWNRRVTIEVKSVPHAGKRMFIPDPPETPRPKPHHNIHKEWAYVQVDTMRVPTFVIMGWCWGSELLEYGKYDNPWNGWCTEADFELNAPEELREIAAGRINRGA